MGSKCEPFPRLVLLPDTAEGVSGTETQTVPISELNVNNVVLVRPGTRVPADGTVVEGSADVDESVITGESHCGCRRRTELSVDIPKRWLSAKYARRITEIRRHPS
jgi:magnesium-transporting ATPase (P-type)